MQGLLIPPPYPHHHHQDHSVLQTWMITHIGQKSDRIHVVDNYNTHLLFSQSVRIWSVETGTYTRLIWASQTTSIMSLSYDKGYFAIAVGDVVSLWRLDTATCLRTFEEHHKRYSVKNIKKITGVPKRRR